MKDYISRRDMAYLGLALVISLLVGFTVGRMDAVDKSVETVSTVSVLPTPTLTVTPTPTPIPTPEPTKPPYIRDDIPLSEELQTVLWEACEDAGVEFAVGLAVIDEESGFDSTKVSRRGCYGLCQLNPKYFPSDLSDEDNIKAGIGYLGELLEKHGDLAAALTAYNRGSDNGSRTYANKVLETSQKYQ